MKIASVDQKRRIRIPGMNPGDHYAIREVEPGHYELAKMIPAQRKTTCDKRAAEKAIRDHALTPALNWEALRQSTREP